MNLATQARTIKNLLETAEQEASKKTVEGYKNAAFYIRRANERVEEMHDEMVKRQQQN